MVATILITIPRKIGDPTFHTSVWGEKMVRIAKGMGYNVVTLKGDSVTYKNTTAAIERYHPRLYIHTGHGCASHLTGQRECVVTRKISTDELMEMGEHNPERLDKILSPVKLSGCNKELCILESNACNPLCFLDTNVHLLKDSIVYAVSCHSAEILGKCAIQYGIQSYIGYDDLLLFPVDSMRSQDMFGDIYIEFVKHLLEGNTVGEANEAMKRMETTYIRLYKQVKWIGLPLLWNHLHREVLGDPTATIY